MSRLSKIITQSQQAIDNTLLFDKWPAVMGTLLFFAAVFATPVPAVELSTDGKGQVLIYPYFTARGDNTTLLSVTNHSSDFKIVRVTFLDGDNGQLVMALNLFLGPFDVWTASTIVNADGEPGFSTRDSSCLAPNVTEFDFFEQLTSQDGGRQSVDRLKEGYVQMIEMGTLEQDSIIATNAAIGADGMSVNCNAISSAYLSSGLFGQDLQNDMLPPSGQLSGEATLINVSGARALAYKAVALDNFYVPAPGINPPSLHTPPGFDGPFLDAAWPPVSRVQLRTANGVEIVEDTWENGQQAVDAVLMTNRIGNQFASEFVINGKTEWVITFPGRNSHVSGVEQPIPPYTSLFASTQPDVPACELADRVFHGRNQERLFRFFFIIATPPGPAFRVVGFCHEVNVISFNNSEALSVSVLDIATNDSSTNESLEMVSDLYASRLFVNFVTFIDSNNRPDEIAESGTGIILFNSEPDLQLSDVDEFVLENAPHQLVNPFSNRVYRGLPAVGIAMRGADNLELNARFGIGVDHSYDRVIEAGE